MNPSYYTNPIEFLISTLFDLYIMALILRFLLQWVRADFYNPVSQFLLKITSPVVLPARRIIPGFRGLDIATLVVAIALEVVKLLLVLSIKGAPLLPVNIAILVVHSLLSLVINIFFFAILIQVILSWISPGSYNPLSGLLYSLTAPILGPVQRLIPPIGGFDLSPLFALIGLKLLEMLLFPPLLSLLRI